MGGLIAIQSTINIAVATGIGPNTGTPLPFISYGLSSLLSLYIGMGVVLNVGLQGRAYDKELKTKSIYEKDEIFQREEYL